MKSPKMPAPPPLPAPPVSATGRETEAAALAAKKRNRGGYNYERTILRPGGLSAMPPGTSSTLGK